MMTKFAKAIAANITLIAGNVAQIAVIDAGGSAGGEDRCIARTNAHKAVKKAESALVELLKQPGIFLNDDGTPSFPFPPYAGPSVTPVLKTK